MPKKVEVYSGTRTKTFLILIILISIMLGYSGAVIQYQNEAVKNGFGYFSKESYIKYTSVKVFHWYTIEDIIEYYTQEAEE